MSFPISEIICDKVNLVIRPNKKQHDGNVIGIAAFVINTDKMVWSYLLIGQRESDSITAIDYHELKLAIYTWDSFRIELDVLNGNVLEIIFTK